MTGLRERKKRETRARIAAAARRLFFEQGYDAVAVTAVAEAADVSPATVFNYFRTKEDLFFSGLEVFEQQLVEAVRNRPGEETVFRAFRDAVLASVEALSDRGAAKGIARAAEVIGSSPGLQAQEHVVRARYAAALAAAIADHPGTGVRAVEAAAIGSALIGVHGAVVDHTRALAARGVRGRQLVETVRREAEAAFDRLGDGLAD